MPVWMLTSIAILALFVLFVLAIAIFKPSMQRRAEWRRDEIRKLEEQGLLTAAEFHAKRAFQIEELEDEGSHYFIELQDGAVLFLSGQYLYDYEVPRCFPCTDFVVRRHATKGFAVDVQCSGKTLEPEVIAPPLDEDVGLRPDAYQDGDVIRDLSYDALKAECLRFGD